MLTVTDPGRRVVAAAAERKPYARIPEVLPIPNLIELQLNSFNWFIENGLRELFDEICPIQDFTGRVMELRFRKYEFEAPKYDELECRTRDLTFAGRSTSGVELLIKETGEIKEQRVFMGDFPFMTDNGTFIINGAERVVVCAAGPLAGRVLHRRGGSDHRPQPVHGQAHPATAARGSSSRPAAATQLSVKVDRKRKIEVTTLLRAAAAGPSSGKRRRCSPALFARVDDGHDRRYIAVHARQGPAPTRATRPCIEVYKQLRPGDPPTGDNAREAGRKPVLQLPPLRPRQGRPLQAQQAARRSRIAWASTVDRAHPHQGDIVEIVRPDDRAQPRPGHRPTTSTTSATAACAPSAS